MSRSLPWLSQKLDQLSADNLLRRRRVTRWLPDGRCDVDGRILCNFIANDYLNLAADPRVIAAAHSAAAEAGLGARASALLGGRSPWHVRLEQRLAEFEGEAATLLFPTGFAANLGTITGLIRENDIIFSDRLNHASLIDGCRLTKAKLRIYRHDDLAGLESELQQAAAFPRRWIVTDGVFSMDGDLAPLAELSDLADKYNAEILVDEAHATGVWGANGRGVAEHFGMEERVAVRIGTLSKAVGTLGGFVSGSQTLIDYLWNSARPQIFSTALPPTVCAAAECALTILQDEPERRMQLQAKSQWLRQRLSELDVAVLPGSLGPILPILVQDSGRVMDIARQLEDRGFLVGAIRPPTVPVGTARLRISVSIAHTADDLSALADSVRDALSGIRQSDSE